MSGKRTFHYRQSNLARAKVINGVIEEMQRRYNGGDDFDVTVSEPKRTLDANSAMWSTLSDISKQVEWPHTDKSGNWTIGLMNSDSWKAILTAAFEQETRQAQGIGGGTVMLGARTSQYSRRKMGEMIEFAHAFGAEKGVRWSARAQDELAEFR